MMYWDGHNVAHKMGVRVFFAGLMFLLLGYATPSLASYYGPPYTYGDSTAKFATVGAAISDWEGKRQASCTANHIICTPLSPVYYDPNSPDHLGTAAIFGYYFTATQLASQPVKNLGGLAPPGCPCKSGEGGHYGASSAQGSSGDDSIDRQPFGPTSTMQVDPINPATGNKYQQDTDFRGSSWLTFRRFYNSRPNVVVPSTLGPQWRHSFDRSLEILLSSAGTSGGSNLIMLTRPDGSREQFTLTSGIWTAPVDTPDILTEQDDGSGNPIGYTAVIAATREAETYSAAGLLQSITDATGRVTTLTYSTTSTPVAVAPSPNLLLTVTDPQSRVLSFTYNSAATIATLTLPDGGVLTYGYDATTGNLTSVQYPDGKTRQYVYNESSLTGAGPIPNAMTGIVDETGTRYETTGYDYYSGGSAVSSSFAGGADAASISYTYMGVTATLTAPLGRSISLSFTNVLGALKAASTSIACGNQCNGTYKAQTYDANGYPASVTDWNGNVTKTTYDAHGLLDVQVDASGSTTSQRTTTTTWNTALRVPLTRIVQNTAGTTVASEAWVYNAAGQVLADCQIDPTVSAASSYACATTGTPPSGVRRDVYSYCTAVDGVQCPLVGLTLSHTDALGHTTGYAYYLTASATGCGTPDAACYQPGDLKTVTDAMGHITSIASYDGTGRVTRTIDPNGVIIDLTYAPRGWLQTRTVRALASGAASPLDATTTITYTAYGAVQTITDPDGIVVTYGYDAAHRLTDVTDAQGNHIHYTLDVSGNRTQEQTFAVGSTTASRSLTRTFNTLGQLTQVIDGLNHTVFDASASGNYDGNGNLVQSKDALNIARRQGYDALNRLSQTIDNYSGADAATKNTTSSFAYDALDRLTGVTDPSNLTTTYGYDGLSNRTSLQSPDTGGSSDTYDAAGNRLTYTDAKGIVSTTAYDALNRPISTSYSDSAQTNDNVTYAYDEANGVTGCSASYPIGRLTRVIESAVTTVYCYDARGNTTRKQQVTSAATDTTSYSYSSADRLNTLAEPSGSLITYSHDSVGRVSSVTVTPTGGSTTTAVSNVSYLPFGPISSYTLGNGQTVTRTYDANYALSDLTSPVLNLHFARDAMGNISAEGNTPGASPATETYGYDPLYRLKSVTDGTTLLQSFTYNPTGDRLSKTGSGLATGTYGYQANTHWLTSIGSAARSYDANGNTIGNSSAGQTWGYGYNGRNRMTVVQAGGATVGTYIYNAMGQRIQKVATLPTAITRRFVYDEANHLIGEYGDDTRDMVWLGDIPVAVADTQVSGGLSFSSVTTFNYVTADHLGTPRAVTNSAGTTIWSWPYVGNAFGELAPTSLGGYTLNLRYPGQYYDAESGLDSNNWRIYDVSSGRFLQTDLLGLYGGQWSTYAYANNNPLIYIDPLGLVDLNIFPVGSPQWKAANNFQSPDGTFTVGAHGNPIQVADANGMRLTPQDLAKMIKNSKNYQTGETVLLLACNTGVAPGKPWSNKSFAQLNRPGFRRHLAAINYGLGGGGYEFDALHR